MVLATSASHSEGKEQYVNRHKKNNLLLPIYSFF